MVTMAATDQIADGYVSSGMRFFSCDRCKKHSRCSDIVWAHKNQMIPPEGLKIGRAGAGHNVELRLCPVCMDEFDEMYRKWREKK